MVIQDPPSGLLAAIVIDDTTLGPAAGGIRTRAYDDLVTAVHEAAGLARAMTIKCALAGLNAGGGKGVVVEHKGLDRAAAFAKLGEEIDKLDGAFRTAGDLGTTTADLEAMAETCRFVHTDEADLSRSVARGLLRCIEAMCRVKERDLEGLKVAVQGCGAIGAAVATTLAEAGVHVLVADVVAGRAEALAEAIGATAVPAPGILSADVDIVAPCAVGGVITERSVAGLRAWGVCGGANNVVADEAAEQALLDRGVMVVPDVLASAGAVVDGIGRTVMGLDDRVPLIDKLGETAERVIRESLETGVAASQVAERLAAERIRAALPPMDAA